MWTPQKFNQVPNSIMNKAMVRILVTKSIKVF